MKTFRSIVPLENPGWVMTHQDKIMMIGSCFSANIGQKLIYHGFDAVCNPFGVLFNPASISQTIRRLIDLQMFSENDFFWDGSLWNSFSCSSHMSGTNLDSVLSVANNRIDTASAHLHNADILMITWGTCWVYELNRSGEIVANCHKLPRSEFSRKRLNVDEIVAEYTILISCISSIKPMKIILTVSPIRHWKDGARENTLSKAILHLAAEALQNLHNNLFYFPAYEILIDELRDYRFYADDLFHPSNLAIEYIWERFASVCYNSETWEITSKIAEYKKMKEHRPLHGDTSAYETFKNKTILVKDQILKKYPFLAGRLIE